MNKQAQKLSRESKQKYSCTSICICLCQASPEPPDCSVTVNHSQKSKHLTSGAGQWKLAEDMPLLQAEKLEPMARLGNAVGASWNGSVPALEQDRKSVV